MGHLRPSRWWRSIKVFQGNVTELELSLRISSVADDADRVTVELATNLRVENMGRLAVDVRTEGSGAVARRDPVHQISDWIWTCKDLIRRPRRLLVLGEGFGIEFDLHLEKERLKISHWRK